MPQAIVLCYAISSFSPSFQNSLFFCNKVLTAEWYNVSSSSDNMLLLAPPLPAPHDGRFSLVTFFLVNFLLIFIHPFFLSFSCSFPIAFFFFPKRVYSCCQHALWPMETHTYIERQYRLPFDTPCCCCNHYIQSQCIYTYMCARKY